MTETGTPATKQEMLAQIDAEWRALMEVVSRLSPEQMLALDEGGWSPKDNLAHLAEWMKILMGYHMDKRPAHEVVGVSSEVAANWDMEEINPVLLERNRARPVEDVLSELQAVFAQVRARLEAMSFDELMQPRHADDPEQRPLLLWVLGDTAEHFEEHRATIEKSL